MQNTGIRPDHRYSFQGGWTDEKIMDGRSGCPGHVWSFHWRVLLPRRRVNDHKIGNHHQYDDNRAAVDRPPEGL
jgi:hypothetical protein